jgi:CheY-like chemotaxis protein
LGPRHPSEPTTWPDSPPSPGSDSKRILVADDEDGTLTLLTATLTYAGFTVVAARDGVEALLRARESPPDLALLDVMMPGLDGREVCRRMAADPALTHVPVILQSSADEQDIDWRGCGASAFLRKPFSIRELPGVVRRHLASHTHAERPRARRLADEEVLEIARQIRAAVRRPPDPNPREGVLSPHRELSPEDEARVEAALVALLTGGDRANERSPGDRTEGGSGQSGDDGTRG